MLQAAPTVAALGTAGTLASSSSASLFGGDLKSTSSSTLFGAASTAAQTLPATSSSSFLFGETPKPASAPPLAGPPLPAPPASRLFQAQDSDSDDWSDDDTSLFGPPKPK
ncbi:hypothetical protein AaE_005059 [Aphanomyces astaci]|nr:hypothetical protein AaE_005059 [Aphanomyces astaci]